MNGERREPPTSRRRTEARKKGQIFRSPELILAGVLLLVYLFLRLTGPEGAHRLLALARDFFGEAAGMSWEEGMKRGGELFLWLTLPFAFFAFFVTLALGFLQTGFYFSPAGIRPVIFSGFRRLFSAQPFLELGKGSLKLALLLGVSFWTIRGGKENLVSLLFSDPLEAVRQVASLADRLVLRLSGVLFLVAGLDFLYQRWAYERRLYMTREEVREEIKETEGNPQIRSARRRRHREVARARMMHQVPRAQVVVTNPTHLAVALRYVPEETDAPVVVAKGKGWLARRIAEVARRHGVPVVSDPPLARSLYRIKLGAAIPPALYRAVAGLLAYLWRTRGMEPELKAGGARA